MSAGVDWSYYNKFHDLIGMYLPSSGEGHTKAHQIVTAVNKLIYKWYNDGDVYDNNYDLRGWANDLSSYANWLYEHVSRSRPILEWIEDCHTEEDYEELLQELAEALLDEEFLAMESKHGLEGSIYNESGPFSFNEYADEDEWEDEETFEDEDEW